VKTIAAKFTRVLRWVKNGVLKVHKYLFVTIFIPPCSQLNLFVNNPGYVLTDPKNFNFSKIEKLLFRRNPSNKLNGLNLLVYCSKINIQRIMVKHST